jgi:hypothetical protein
MLGWVTLQEVEYTQGQIKGPLVLIQLPWNKRMQVG